MGNTFYFAWEVSLIEFLQSHMNEFLIKIASIISALGEELFMVLFLGFFYWVWDKKIGLRIGMNITIVDIMFPFIKNIAKRNRPYIDNEAIKCLKPIDKNADIMDIVSQGYSFPSGHSANTAAAFSSLYYFFRKKIFKLFVFLLPLLVGLSRVVLGVHYPTDVIVGWIIGYSVVSIMPILIRQFKNERKLYYILFFISCIGIFFAKSNDYYTSLGIMLGLLLGTGFEERYVHFENTRKPLCMILRVVGGIVIFLGLNTLLKLPFSDDLLNSASTIQFLIRFLRYTIILFIESGIYPMIFGKFKKKEK